MQTIGWLAKSHDFAVGPTSEGFRDELFRICGAPSDGHRGYHKCEWCDYPWGPLEMTRHGARASLGSGIIVVEASSTRAFVSPNLIVHYVCEHQYQPPAVFIDAVMACGFIGRDVDADKRFHELLSKLAKNPPN